ncbi:MAG: 4-hydroxy-tetrahydrodipicolinate synthase [Gammaproteobacteria bacterium]|nr:4-hydroxy-tetrahydrodipicolinate synthase [Gammaproteobacteria bacterium]
MISGSLVAIVTPFTATGEVDYSAYRSLVEWHVAAGTAGIVVAGTTGEASSLSFDEIQQLVELTREVAGKRLAILVGNGNIATAKTVALTEQMNRWPIDGFLTVTPYYVKPSQAGLIAHFTAIADVAAAPIYLYNVPGRTAVDLTNESVFTLAQHPNIVGIKDATGDLARGQELIERLGGQFCMLSGDDATAHDFMKLGGHGVISVTANIVPAAMAQRYQLAQDGNMSEADAVEAQIKPLHHDLFVEANPIPVKWALAQMGKIELAYRLPLTPLTVTAELNQSMQRLNLVAAGDTK